MIAIFNCFLTRLEPKRTVPKTVVLPLHHKAMNSRRFITDTKIKQTSNTNDI